jgi:signal transduction histidine kinase
LKEVAVAQILIADDQPDTLYVLERLLRKEGHSVVSAGDGRTALALAHNQQPDLIVLDVMMPDMNGFEVIEQLRAHPDTRTTPVMVLTANALDEHHKVHGLSLGADEYLSNPINNNEFIARVQALLRSKLAQDEIKARNAQLAALLDIVQASTSTLDLSEVGRRLIERALVTTRMELGGLWRAEQHMLVCIAQHGYRDPFTAPRMAISLAESRVSAQVMRTGQPVYGSTATLLGIERALAQDAQTVVVLPLLHRGVALGVLHLGTRQARRIDGELPFLSAIANAAAGAVQNAYLFEQAEQQRRLLEQLDQEREEFISIIAHELKNPLASIKGYAGLLQRRAKKDPAGQSALKGLDVIEQQANRMSMLLDQLRDVSQIGADRFTIEPAPLDLAVLTQRIVADMQATTTDHVVQLVVRDEPLMTLGDEFRMAQVLGNLIGNAIKYSPDGGQIDVVVERNDDPPFRPHDADALEWATVTVRDQGIGIPVEGQQRLFERFFRAPNAKGKVSGMGLGLYITREIVARHGGYLWLESEENQGSLFGVALPLHADLHEDADVAQGDLAPAEIVG